MGQKDIDQMLTDGEEVLFAAEQGRFTTGGSSTTPNSVYITKSRIIFKNPRMLGSQSRL